MKYVENKELKKIYEESGDNFENRFRRYGFVLNVQYRRSLARHTIQLLANDVLDQHTGLFISELNKSGIFKYLNNAQLQNFFDSW